jgi:hypothetical protein
MLQCNVYVINNLNKILTIYKIDSLNVPSKLEVYILQNFMKDVRYSLIYSICKSHVSWNAILKYKET